jgi:hypothetical protein
MHVASIDYYTQCICCSDHPICNPKFDVDMVEPGKPVVSQFV